ncbi:unnamed protein product [Bursaphelenchus okinawaensis]|uniref:Transthyretin-like protein n=1 Tax=Bursaphelenchus okinawaensis TaxID=465554 RepID=A0A811KD07_9BILA|nr:unnamed protein product [Bursaphelenchus okinawaensis]CAG9097526.1 unnamed protein product [Bursaphelenchus okinawaensis]
MRSLYLLGLALVLLGSVEAMRKQGVAVKGRLMCGGKGCEGAKVRITDIDTGPDPDDTLDEKLVEKNGEFKLTGFTRELTDIDPVLYVWHNCNDEATPCERKLKFIIPKKYIISTDPEDQNWCDVGIINLQTTFDSEKRECIN